VHEDIDIARAAAELPGMALAGEADALPVVNPGRNVDLERTLLRPTPCSLAVRTGRCHDLARPVALATRLRTDELAEDGR
jgi:hypothetical protein